MTGGNNAEKASIYKDGEGWVPGPDMNIPRGYHASATTSTGDVRCQPFARTCVHSCMIVCGCDVDVADAVAHLCVF